MVGLNCWRWRIAAAAAAVALGLAGAVPAAAPAAAYAEATPAPAASEEQDDAPTSGQGWHLEGTTIVIDGALPKWQGSIGLSEGGPAWRVLGDKVTSFEIKPGASAKTLHAFFADLGNLTSIKGLKNLKTTGVTDASDMFSNTKFVPDDLKDLDFSSVTDMSDMFLDCLAPVIDLRGVDTSNVTDMHEMFHFSGAKEYLLAGMNTSRVRNMRNMFSEIREGSGPVDLDLSDFDTSSVEDMSFFMSFINGFRSVIMGPKLKIINEWKPLGPHDDGEHGYISQDMFSNQLRPAYPQEGKAFKGIHDFKAYQNKVQSAQLYIIEGYVTVSIDGEPPSSSQILKAGEKAAKPADPKREGYTFAGWYSDAKLTKAFDFNAGVTGDVKLYPKWVANTYTVAFNANGGSAVAGQKVEYGKPAAKPADPTRSGYTFGGWYSDAKLTKTYDFKVTVSGDLTLYAKWTKNPAPAPKTFTVSFNSNGGSAVAAQKVAEGKAVAKPADPKRDGYTFQGWFSDKALTKAYDFKAAVKADATLYAKWAKAAVPAPKPESRPSDQFTDVTGASTWVINQGYLDYAVEHGLMTGYRTDGKPNGKFGPTDTLTRGQVAVVLYRVATGKDSGDGSTGFKDQGAFPYYRTAIKWLKDQGLATGDRDPVTQAPLGTFRPDDPITRQELATLVYRFALKQGVKPGKVDTGSLGTFRDGSDVMPYAREAVAWCNAAKVITGGQGADAGKLMPLDNAQRAQAAKIFTVLHRDVLKLGE